MHISKFIPLSYVQLFSPGLPNLKGYVYTIKNDIYFRTVDQMFRLELHTDRFIELNPISLSPIPNKMQLPSYSWTPWEGPENHPIHSSHEPSQQFDLLS